MSHDSKKKNPLAIVFFTIFVDMLGFGILIPVIPLLLANPRSPYYLLPAGWTPEQGFILLGFLTAMFPLMQFFSTPILGQLSDRYGRKKLLALSLAGTCLSYVLFALGIIWQNLPLLFFARAFDGITGGNISIAQASIADVTTPENRAKNFGLVGAAFGLGFIIGPYIGGKLSDPTLISWFNAATPFWFAAILSLTNTLFVLWRFPETLAHPKSGLAIHWSRALLNIQKAFKFKGLRALFSTNFFYQGGFTFFTTFFSVFMIKRFGYSQGQIGDYFSYVGLWIAFTQAVVTRFLAKQASEDQILRVSIFGTGLFMAGFFLTSHPWELFLLSPFFAVFNGLTMANLTALISRSADPSVQGEVMGLNASVQALASSIPPMLSGFIAAKLTPESPIMVSSAVIIFAGMWFLMLYRRPRAPLSKGFLESV